MPVQTIFRIRIWNSAHRRINKLVQKKFPLWYNFFNSRLLFCHLCTVRKEIQNTTNIIIIIIIINVEFSAPSFPNTQFLVTSFPGKSQIVSSFKDKFLLLLTSDNSSYYVPTVPDKLSCISQGFIIKYQSSFSEKF